MGHTSLQESYHQTFQQLVILYEDQVQFQHLHTNPEYIDPSQAFSAADTQELWHRVIS